MENTPEGETARRVIKRYSNRKLYDTRDSRYVTLLQIAEMVRQGEDVQIIDNTTKEDKTEVTLALAISEELKTKPRAVPLSTLRNLIQEQGEKLLTSLRDGPIGKLIPDAPEAEGDDRAESLGNEPRHKVFAEVVATSKQALDQWQHAVDERVRAVLPSFSLFLDVQSELRRLEARVLELEANLEDMRNKSASRSDGEE